MAYNRFYDSADIKIVQKDMTFQTVYNRVKNQDGIYCGKGQKRKIQE